MANGAARALRRVANFEHFRQALGARSFERRIRPRVMKIVRGPDGELFALFARAAVATAGTARLGAEKFWIRFVSQKGGRHQQESQCSQDFGETSNIERAL
jgi:hypothetical protein